MGTSRGAPLQELISKRFEKELLEKISMSTPNSSSLKVNEKPLGYYCTV